MLREMTEAKCIGTLALYVKRDDRGKVYWYISRKAFLKSTKLQIES